MLVPLLVQIAVACINEFDRMFNPAYNKEIPCLS